jgi:hypothetical protein
MGWKYQRKAEVVHSDSKRIKYLCIDSIFIQIDNRSKVHLFSDLLHSGFGAKGGNVGTNVAMSICDNPYKNLNKKRLIYLFEIDIVAEYESEEFQDVLLGLEYRCQLLDRSDRNASEQDRRSWVC